MLFRSHRRRRRRHAVHCAPLAARRIVDIGVRRAVGKCQGSGHAVEIVSRREHAAVEVDDGQPAQSVVFSLIITATQKRHVETFNSLRFARISLNLLVKICEAILREYANFSKYGVENL